MAKNPLIKRAYTETEFTPDQLVELQRCASDLIYFATHYIYVQHPTKGKILFEPRKYQLRALQAFLENRFVITMQSRQNGKTLTIAIYLLWYACFHFDQSILVASNHDGNAKEIIHRIRFAYEEMPDFLKPGVVYYTKHDMEFDNGSRIWSEATSETTGRGKSISMAMVDELAFIKRTIQDEFWASIFPVISTGGKLLISSTPNGDSDLFAQLWRGAETGVNGFFPLKIHWSERDDIDPPKFESEMRGKFGETKWKQEFDLEMISSDAVLVDQMAMKRQVAKQPEWIERDFKFWEKFKHNHTYAVSCDVGSGQDQDFSVIEVFDIDTLTQVVEYRSNKIREHQLYNALKWIIKYIATEGQHKESGQRPRILWSFEENGIGHSLVNLYLKDQKFEEDLALLYAYKPEEAPELVSTPNKIGLNTNVRTKRDGCRLLKRLLEKVNNGLVIKSSQLIAELKEFVARGASYGAKAGATDDTVMATVIGMMILTVEMEYDKELFEKLEDVNEDFVLTEEGNEFDEPAPVLF